jgi:hypothetical protein
MTNIESTVAPAAATEPAAPAVELSAAEWKDKFDREVKGRQAERNLYRPAMDAFEGLHADDVNQLRELGRAVARGDSDYITEWGLQTLSNVNGGKSPAEIIAARQAATPNTATDISTAATAAPAAPAASATTAADVEAAVAKALAAAEDAREERGRVQALISGYNSKMDAAGIERGSEAYYDVIDMTRVYKGDIDKALKVYAAGEAAKLAGVSAAAATAAGTPAPAPTGAPSASTPASELTPRQKALLRITGQKPQ